MSARSTFLPEAPPNPLFSTVSPLTFSTGTVHSHRVSLQTSPFTGTVHRHLSQVIVTAAASRERVARLLCRLLAAAGASAAGLCCRLASPMWASS
eukprot:5147861-Pleurochrysis_carterae.AAC.2